MLKIALVNPDQGTKYPQPSMGLALIAAVLEKPGYPVTIMDADVVGLTAMTPTIDSAVATACQLNRVYPGPVWKGPG